MDRTYLFVPPEEKAEVESLGAQWDTVSKRWYIGPGEQSAKFSKWLPPFEENEADEEFPIVSSEAFVAATTVRCLRCRANIEVIRTRSRKSEAGHFANHCPHCGAIQQDLYLHTEPDEPFFDILRAPDGSIKLTPLNGTVRLGGGEHFTIE